MKMVEARMVSCLSQVLMMVAAVIRVRERRHRCSNSSLNPKDKLVQVMYRSAQYMVGGLLQGSWDIRLPPLFIFKTG